MTEVEATEHPLIPVTLISWDDEALRASGLPEGLTRFYGYTHGRPVAVAIGRAEVITVLQWTIEQKGKALALVPVFAILGSTENYN